MPFSIVIPDDVDFAGAERGATDVASFYEKLCGSNTRSVLFYEETFTGYIVHTCSAHSSPPATVYLSVVSRHNDVLGERDNFGPDGPVNDSTSASLEGKKMVVSDLLFQEWTSAVDGVTKWVSIWRFAASAGRPKRDSRGYTEFSVSCEKPGQLSSNKSRQAANAGSIASTTSAKESPKKGSSADAPSLNLRTERAIELPAKNLLEELNYGMIASSGPKFEFLHRPAGVSATNKAENGDSTRKLSSSTAELHEGSNATLVDATLLGRDDSGTHQHSDMGLENSLVLQECSTLSLETSIPLSLKLRTTKPGGRTEFLLTTLRIEAPEHLIRLAANSGSKNKYYFHVLSLETDFKGGEISLMGDVQFPYRCAPQDILNVTYKLVNHDGLDIGSEVQQDSSRSSKPVQFKVYVQIEREDNSEQSVRVTNEICTTWEPILEFNDALGVVFPGAHGKPPLSPLLSHSFQRSRNNVAKGMLNYGPKKSATTNNIITTPGLTLEPPQSPRATTWNKNAMSPGSLRPPITNLSSPLLSMGRSNVAKKKSPRDLISNPHAASSITVNLSGDGISVLTGLKLAFFGSPSVKLGEVATWKVQAINQTNRSLKLSLIVSPVRKLNSVYLQSHMSNGGFHSSSHNNFGQKGPDTNPSPGAFVQSRHQLQEQYNALKPSSAGVIVLSNDVSLGILDPNQVFESEIKFFGLTKGIHNCSILRLVESTTGEAVEIGRFLEFFVT